MTKDNRPDTGPDTRPDTEIVTRFAPSPTGYLHIGGARTALFNWLYARGRGGKFLLRIEDTDRARHSEEAVAAILDGLIWLGLDWDGEPVSQHACADRHKEVAEQLLASGNAYRCYLTPDELDAARETARAEKSRFESPWRNAPESDWPEGAPFAVRFKAPAEGKTAIDDQVQGRVEFPNHALDDLIILRSDGSPTYNLSVVVDDHDMGVTHIIRGDDHLNNAARQQQIYEALGWPSPVFAHVPLIHGSDGAKLSKRHGALGVEAYRDMGFLAEGLSNYLLRLGWAHGDEEIIDQDAAKKLFDLGGINKAPARLDLDKLKFLNAHYIAALGDEDFVARAVPFLSAAGIHLQNEDLARLTRSAPAMKERCQTLADIVDASAYLFLERPIELSGKKAKPLAKEGARAMLTEIADQLTNVSSWDDPQALDELLKTFAENREVGFGAVGQPVRAALTGGLPAPGLGDVLFGLGKGEALARLRDQAA